jgi:hypothetical protein
MVSPFRLRAFSLGGSKEFEMEARRQPTVGFMPRQAFSHIPDFFRSKENLQTKIKHRIDASKL